MRSVGAEQQDGSAERVPVSVELLGPHGGEEVGEDSTDVPVHSLQRHVHALTGRLVQKTLQPSDIWRKKRGGQRVRRKPVHMSHQLQRHYHYSLVQHLETRPPLIVV